MCFKTFIDVIDYWFIDPRYGRVDGGPTSILSKHELWPLIIRWLRVDPGRYNSSENHIPSWTEVRHRPSLSLRLWPLRPPFRRRHHALSPQHPPPPPPSPLPSPSDRSRLQCRTPPLVPRPRQAGSPELYLPSQLETCPEHQISEAAGPEGATFCFPGLDFGRGRHPRSDRRRGFSDHPLRPRIPGDGPHRGSQGQADRRGQVGGSTADVLTKMENIIHNKSYTILFDFKLNYKDYYVE